MRHRWVDAVSLTAVLSILALLVVVAKDSTVTAAKKETPAARLADIKPDELAGIVNDADGNPMKGVIVDVWTWYKGKGDEAVTDKDGVFRFRPNSDGGRTRVEVRFSKPGYSPHYIVQQPVGVKGLVITLNSKTLIEGVLRSPDEIGRAHV